MTEEQVAAAMTAYVEMKLCPATNVRLLAPLVAAAIEKTKQACAHAEGLHTIDWDDEAIDAVVLRVLSGAK